MQEQTVPQPVPEITRETGRIKYLDVLRVVAVLMVFLFHAAKPFTAGEWHIMNDQISLVGSILFVAFLGPWGMPFFFLLAGASTWFALQRRTARQFANERFRRLLIPFLVGSAFATPVQNYYEWQFNIRTEGTASTCLQTFLDRWNGWNPTISDWIGYHLWFLLYLFIFSLLALPVLTWLRAQTRGLIPRLASAWERRGGLLLFALPPLLIQVGLRPIFPAPHEWADFLYDLYFFLSGYLIFADERFTRAIRQDRWLALALGSLAFLGLVLTLAMGQAETLFSDPGTPGYRLFWGLASVDAWCWSLVMIWVGMRYLDFSHPWTRYGQEAIMPFYLLHQPVIVAIAFYVVLWPVGVTLKMLVVMSTSFLISIAIYELLIRRLPPIRAVFGMKAPLKSPGVRRQESPSTLTSR